MTTTYAVSMIQLHPFRRKRDGEIEYLVLKRAQDQRAYPGLWQVVTGRIEAGETAWQAALREVKEETSLLPVQSWVLPYVTTLYSPHRDRIVHAPCFACEATHDDTVHLSPEHEEFRWCSFDEAMTLMVFPSHHEAMRVLREYLLRDGGIEHYTTIPI